MFCLSNFRELNVVYWIFYCVVYCVRGELYSVIFDMFDEIFFNEMLFWVFVFDIGGVGWGIVKMDLMMKWCWVDRESEREEKIVFGVGLILWGIYCFCRGVVVIVGLWRNSKVVVKFYMRILDGFW